MTQDEAQIELRRAGWSFGETTAAENGKLVWQVYCHRGEQSFTARSESRPNAWVAAVKMAADVKS